MEGEEGVGRRERCVKSEDEALSRAEDAAAIRSIARALFALCPIVHLVVNSDLFAFCHVFDGKYTDDSLSKRLVSLCLSRRHAAVVDESAHRALPTGIDHLHRRGIQKHEVGVFLTYTYVYTYIYIS